MEKSFSIVKPRVEPVLSIGARLREERERLGSNQEAFARLTPARTRQSQSNYEKGATSPDTLYLAAIAAVGADTHYIVTGQRVGKGPPWKDSRSDEAIWHAVSDAPNRYAAFEGMKKIRDATDLLQRLQAEAGFDLPGAWALTLQELLFGDQITEEGARRIIHLLTKAAPK